MQSEAEIEALVEQGDYRAAASAYEALGLVGKAQILYERLFDYGRAGELAEQQSDHIKAVELFLKGNQLQRAESVRRRLMAELSDDIPKALRLFEQRGYFLQAAELAESIGNLAQAARLYMEGSTYDRAGALFERLGRLREAGEAYEAFLRGSPEHGGASLGLGRVLQRFGRHREAIPLLSRSAAHPKTLDEAGRRIAFAFFKLGLLEAGRAALERVGMDRSTEPEAFMRPFEDELLQGGGEGGEAGGAGGARGGGGALEGRYRLEQPLGGRIAASYSARDLLRDRKVALRFYPGSAEANADFYAELRQLKSPPCAGHVRLLEINPKGGFVVTEWVEGRSLLETLNGPSPPAALQCRAIALSVLDAVVAAHKRGILHGALSPASVRLGAGGVVLVDDWGVHLIERRMATQTGGPESSFAYRAPEVNLGRGADFRADLYSIAALLYRCLLGHAPQMGRGGEGWEGWPEAFGRFFQSALAAHADARPASVALFQRGLKQLPWQQVRERRLEPVRVASGASDSEQGPRLVLPEGLEAGRVAQARDTLLERDVRVLKLPPEDARPLHLVDRLHVLASPECPAFQDVLRLDKDQDAILLEVFTAPTVAAHFASSEAEAVEADTLLDWAEPLLGALAIAHASNLGLGTVSPDHVRFDGLGFRVPIEGALLVSKASNAEAMQRDTAGFAQVIMTALTGEPVREVVGPRRMLELLRERGVLAPADVDVLSASIPASVTSLAAFPEWFDDLKVAVEVHASRKQHFDRLVRFATANDRVSPAERAYLEQRRKALGIDTGG